MARIVLLGVVAVVAALASSGAAAAPTALSGRVLAPPEVQLAGRTYVVKVIVSSTRPIRPFCLDFEDDNNSWKIRVPGLSVWDDDVFCTGLAPTRRKVFTAYLIAARPGQRTLEIGMGKATLFRASRGAVLDAKSLWWSGTFVIV